MRKANLDLPSLLALAVLPGAFIGLGVCTRKLLRSWAWVYLVGAAATALLVFGPAPWLTHDIAAEASP